MRELTLQQRRSQFTLDTVKAAAERVINREGVMSFTTAQIAEEAGVSIGTVYRYFKNRVDVVDSLVPGFSNRVTDEFQFDLHQVQVDAERLAAEERGEGLQVDPGSVPSHSTYTGILRAS